MATLEELQTRRAAYVAAELKILQSQEYVVGQGGTNRRSRRAELESVQAGIRQIDLEIDKLQARTTRRVYTLTPR